VAVLNSLDFRLAASTVMNFLDRFLHVVAVHEEQRIVHLARVQPCVASADVMDMADVLIM